MVCGYFTIFEAASMRYFRDERGLCSFVVTQWNCAQLKKKTMDTVLNVLSVYCNCLTIFYSCMCTLIAITNRTPGRFLTGLSQWNCTINNKFCDFFFQLSVALSWNSSIGCLKGIQICSQLQSLASSVETLIG